MSLQTLLKNKQNRLLSKTWRTVLTAREIEKNNYHVTGDLQKARNFAFTAAMYKLEPCPEPETPIDPVVIYSRQQISAN